MGFKEEKRHQNIDINICHPDQRYKNEKAKQNIGSLPYTNAKNLRSTEI